MPKKRNPPAKPAAGPPTGRPKARARPAAVPSPSDFDAVLALIDAARARALAAVNTELIDLYWQIGEHISRRVTADGWGEGTVEALAGYIRKRQPNASGFSARNLWRMMQFYETYRAAPKLSPLVRELSWTHNLLILSRCKREEEREFYLRVCRRERWGKRELERQLAGALFERTVLSPAKLSPAVTVLHPDAGAVFKDTYLLEFLDLPPSHSEADLQRGLVEQLRRFLIELGRDFCFVGSQYPLQVGGRDFALDLLFFNRELNALVAFEIKIDEFQPEHLGKLEFYLEALDRDVRKPHEQPSIGVLLCATKNHEVVEYALSRAVSPALVAEYQTRLPDKALLQAKLHEFYALAQEQAIESAPAPKPPARPATKPSRPDRPAARKPAKKGRKS
jgi:predicted nuclease of restriction endonuclease-like (RecB) superfamily